MSETTALKKLRCPGCGADAHWNAAQQALVCPYCGHSGPVEASASEVRELDLPSALRAYTAAHGGWQTEKTAVRCQSCQAISLFEPGRVAQRCDFCGAAALIPYEQTAATIYPESVLPFKVSETEVRDAMRKWYGSRWFAPNKLKHGALTDRVHGVYLPYWTFDANAHAEWTAESGYHYYVTETYTDSDGKTKTRQVQRTRWEHSSGSLDHFFNDDLVCGSSGVSGDLMRQVEPYPTGELLPYSPGYVAGWVVEQYQIDLAAAAERSRGQMNSVLHSKCASEVPGDTHRNLEVRARYYNQTFKHILAPVWLLSFTYGAKSYQVVINGCTGEIAGRYPKSGVKIFFFVLFLLAVCAGIGLFFASQR